MKSFAFFKLVEFRSPVITTSAGSESDAVNFSNSSLTLEDSALEGKNAELSFS